MNLTQRHSLSQEDAINRIKSLSEQLYQANKKDINSFNQQWKANKADVLITIMRMKFKGQVEITSHDVCVKIALPFAALLFKKKIENEIKNHLKNTLS